MDSFSSPRLTCIARSIAELRSQPIFAEESQLSTTNAILKIEEIVWLHRHRLDPAFSNHGYEVLVVAHARRLAIFFFWITW